jgi:flagellar capping protein FliD
VTATINSTSDGLLLTQVGGAGTASVSEVAGGNTAAALNIKGTLATGTLNGKFPPVLPSSAVKGIGATLSDLLDRFTNAQTGIIFKSSDTIGTKERQLKSHQTSLAELLIAKKNRMILQFANLETTIAQLQSQGTAITNFKAATSASSK